MADRGFGAYHPFISLTYFVCVIGFSVFFMHPVCLLISLICALLYLGILRGGVGKTLIYILPLMVFTALLNPLFSHGGVTILAYLPDGNPITAESVIYGLCAAVMLVSVMCWFLCFSHVMTSDKLIYLFGKIVPSLSLIFSMTLRFVPEFTRQTREVAEAQKCIGRDVSEGGIITRAKNGLSVLSVMVTRALEGSIEKADSMKARGYGLRGRTAFSIYRMEGRDGVALLCILLLSAYIIFCAATGNMNFEFYPQICSVGVTSLSVTAFAAYLLLGMIPVIIEIWEVRRWAKLKSKI